MGKIKDTLLEIGAISEDNIEIYARRTRDNPSLNVYMDRASGVIFIDDYYVGEQEYRDGGYRASTAQASGSPGLERQMDMERRIRDYRQFCFGKIVLDFGCGAGDFLLGIRSIAREVYGCELQQDYINWLASKNVRCVDQIEILEDKSIDVVFGFHSLEHFSNPIELLENIKKKMKDEGYVIFEVPHASDFLIRHLSVDAFREFTLWSQHLVLHTRNSLERLFTHCGFKNLQIQAKQRYPLSNHLHWLTKGKPAGHKSALSLIDTPGLTHQYEQALQAIDATDTLILVGQC